MKTKGLKMPRVKDETVEKLINWIESLPSEMKDKCALCNETLTHIVKKAEAETGAGTATVTKALADNINATAAPGDQINPEALHSRVRRHEGSIMSNRHNKTAEPDKITEPEIVNDPPGTAPTATSDNSPKPRSDLQESIIQIAGDLNILRSKIEKINQSKESLIEGDPLKIYCRALRDFKPILDEAFEICIGGES